MTAEIAILNREAIALAAGSASTMRSSNRQKILSSANKIFSLSKCNPVGIMIYGNAVFMGIPVGADLQSVTAHPWFFKPHPFSHDITLQIFFYIYEKAKRTYVRKIQNK